MKMKSALILLSIGIVSVTNSFAQKHTIGFQGGMVSSGMSMDYERNLDSRDKKPIFQRITNLHFALSYGYNFLGKFHLNTGLELTNKGSIIRLDTSFSDYFSGTSRYQTNTIEILTYLVVPVSISRHIHLDKNGRHKLILTGGVNYNYLIKAMTEGYSLVEHTPPGSSEVETYKKEEIDPVKMEGYSKWDFSVHFWGGYRFQLNDDLGFGIDYRYLSNFRNINETRFRYEQMDKSYSYHKPPTMNNLNNHIFSVGIFMSPRLFFGLE